MDLSDLIERNAAFTPDKLAIRHANAELTFGGLSRRIHEFARALKSRLRINRGDRIAVLATNHPDYLVLLYACARLGAMLVPLNWRLATAEQLFILRNAGVKVLVVERDLGAIIAPLAQILPRVAVVGLDFAPSSGTSMEVLANDATGDGRHAHVDLSLPLLIVYTSGTTGYPKGAVLRQEALIWNAVMSQHMHDMTAADHVLTVLPLFHVGGLNIQTTPALQLGATVTLHARFSPGQTLEAIERDRPSLVVLVPATMQAMIEHERWSNCALSGLRAVTTGSTQVPQYLIDAFVGRGIPVLQVYGSTETCPIAVYTRLSGDWLRPGSAGLPGLVCEAKIVDDQGVEQPPGEAGEIVVRGPNLLREYWGDGTATSAALRAGWYHSGDIGRRDQDGYFYVHDRKKWQEVPLACIVQRAGLAARPEEIESFCLQHLARYKVPREYLFLESLPQTAMGKIQHFRLKEILAAQAPARPFPP
ncbi:MAG: AMP-binding protein [Proteobacteria bacterium]|nr:AMP-binding protein [Pseudomonadota bacterium]